MKTYTRKYKWGVLRIRSNFSDAASVIQYSTDGGEWDYTPLQVADVRHNSSEALAAVNRWLARQAG